MIFKSGIVEIRQAKKEDIKELRNHLRIEDHREVMLSGFHNNEAALEHGLANSTESYTVLVEGKVSAMFGINPRTLLGAEAVIWFLGRPEMARIKKTFMRVSRYIVNEWRRRYLVLYNVVPLDYAKSLAWLRWLGVNVDKTVTLGGREWQLMAFVMEA